MKLRTKKLTFRILICIFLLALFASPGFASVTVLGELTHDFAVRPGEVIKDKIRLKNNGSKDVIVNIYAKDYFFTAQGKSYYMNPGDLDRSNASWIKLERSRITIAPDSIVTINYTLTVPDEDNLTGTYWSILMVEPQSKDFLLERIKDKINVGIHETVRFGIQVVTSISGTGSKEIDFVKAELTSDIYGNLWLNVDLKNKGNLWLRPDVWIDLYSESGASIGRFEGTRMRIFPETSIRQKVNLGNLRTGKYMALVVADSDDDYIVGAEYRLAVE